jgi:hypothetical protein
VHEQHDNPAVGLVLVGFSPPERFTALARHLRWPGLVLVDPSQQIYQALGIGRAPLGRVYSPGTLLTYARAAKHGRWPSPPTEDTRQLGGDAVLVDGRVVQLWRPARPTTGRPRAPCLRSGRSALVTVGEALSAVGGD